MNRKWYAKQKVEMKMVMKCKWKYNEMTNEMKANSWQLFDVVEPFFLWNLLSDVYPSLIGQS